MKFSKDVKNWICYKTYISEFFLNFQKLSITSYMWRSSHYHQLDASFHTAVLLELSVRWRFQFHIHEIFHKCWELNLLQNTYLGFLKFWKLKTNNRLVTYIWDYNDISRCVASRSTPIHFKFVYLKNHWIKSFQILHISVKQATDNV